MDGQIQELFLGLDVFLAVSPSGNTLQSQQNSDQSLTSPLNRGFAKSLRHRAAA